MRTPRALVIPFLCTLLPLGSLAAQALSPEQEEQQKSLLRDIESLEEKLAVTRAAGLKPIRVNGVELTPQHIRREAIYLVGPKIVEAKISDFFVQEWMENQIEEGRDPEEFGIAEEDVDASLREQVREFREKNPGVEFWAAVRSLTGFGKQDYMRQFRQTELFKKVFFPGPASNWPSITREAIMASAAQNTGQQFWDNIEKNSVDPETGEPRELPAFWIQLCQGWVQKQLKQWSDIRYPSDGLPAEIVLQVNGRDWMTDEAFAQVRKAVFLTDIERAMTELVVREALTQELKAKDAYLDDERFQSEYDIYAQEFDKTPFTTEVVATAFKGYPSLEAFRQRWRLMRSFEHMIDAELTNENLAEHAENYQSFFADGQINVEIIQFLARDVKTGAWEPDGFLRAKERATEAFEKLADGADFDEVHAEHGEYYVTDDQRGRFSGTSLNGLRQWLRENEFSDLLQGYSIGSHLFYEVEPGSITSPLRGPDGYYICRVNALTPSRRMVQLSDPRTRDLVRQDYVNTRFLKWSNEVLAKTSVD